MKTVKKINTCSIILFICIFFNLVTIVNAEKSTVIKSQRGERTETLADKSISEDLVGATLSKLIVVPSPSGEVRKEYDSNAVGLKKALFDMYEKNDGQNYAIYIGTNITTINGADANLKPENPSETNATFKMLEGRIGTLTLTGTATDEITNDTTLADGAKTFAFNASAHMGTDLIIRNISYTGTAMYMNGHNISLNGGSRGNGFSIYGGSEEDDITGDPEMVINTTGTGTWDFYGGSKSGVLTGNPKVVVNNTSGAIRVLSAGNNTGTVQGNLELEINDTSGAVTTIYSAGNSGNVRGNVKTTIHNENIDTTMRLGTIYGASYAGNVTGSVSTTLRGYGGWNSNTTAKFIGGSESGNIGTDKVKDGITSIIDTSLFSTGAARFIGGNNSKGTIVGNINSTIKAGTANKGSFLSVSGGGGIDVARLSAATIGASNKDVYDAMTKAERASKAESAAAFKVYGNILTELKGGQVSSDGDANYTRGAGYGGYIEGDSTLITGSLNPENITGGEGFVYSRMGASVTDLAYHASPRVGSPSSIRTYTGNNWDIVAGGGSPGAPYIIYIKGNTKLVHNNVLARWTYGGGFSGVIDGKSEVVLNHGLVDTLEGAGYQTDRIYEGSRATMSNGEVNFFFSGGGWDDNKIVGDVTALATGGVINGSIGGSYGSDVIEGNSEVEVRGGDFSGYPSHGTPGFSGGVTDSGQITGDATLTLDLREGDGFKFPSNTSVTGGSRYGSGAATSLGTDENSLITLNIFTKPGEDVLNGANIYGDGGNGTNTKSGKIIMNIDAPDSSIGNVYATEYSVITTNRLRRDIQINLERAKSIQGLSGGNATDNITNTIYNNSINAVPKKEIKVAVGENVLLEGNNEISFQGVGLINFTDLKLYNQTKLIANGANLLNGRSATAVNHGATYSDFGNVTLNGNSGIGVSSGTNYISIGSLMVEDEGSIESSQGTGKINLSDINFKNADSRLTWIKNTTTDTLKIKAKGNYFGEQDAFQVLTFNPLKTNAEKLTPFNFMGIEKSTGKTYLGDTDTSNPINGYGIMIPGSVIDYKVSKPVMDGKGDLEHNVTSVLSGNTPLPLKTWGTEVAGTKVQKGRLIIPEGEKFLPTITMTPETALTGSWVAGARVTTTKLGEISEEILEKSDSKPVEWSSKNGSYSYNLETTYSNKAELSARSVIITETEARTIKSEADVDALTEVSGRPFLESSITASMIETINAPLKNDELYKKVEITYSAGTSTSNPNNVIEIKQPPVNIVVVKDGSKISEDKNHAIYAQDAEIGILEAQELISQELFEKDYTKVFAIDSTGKIEVNDATDNYFETIKGTETAEAPKNIKVTYSVNTGKEIITKEITVHIIQSKVSLTINFVNEIGQEIHETIIRQDQLIGTKVDLSNDTEVKDIINVIENKHYKNTKRPENESEVPIVAGGTTVTYQFTGILVLESVPKVIDFGNVSITNFKKMVGVNNNHISMPLLVIDTRMRKSEWDITAQVEKEMTNGDDIQTGSLKYVLNKNKITLNGSSKIIYTHDVKAEENEVNISNDWEKGELSDGIKLKIDSERVPKTTGSYEGVIRWTLRDTIE